VNRKRDPKEQRQRREELIEKRDIERRKKEKRKELRTIG